jgi:tRNA(His) 5'-end guanylyltransferase
LAQRSTWSMTFWWLGLTGFGASGSSESLRGNLTSSVMAYLPLKENAPARESFQY